jgi:hypothetical protein
MHTATKYREMAEECFEWASAASTEEIRANYLNIAKLWLRAAASLDGGLPIRGWSLKPSSGNGKLSEPGPV